MNKKQNIIILGLILVLSAVFVAADNGVFDDTNYNENNIYNITNATVTQIIFANDATHIINDNATCITIIGDTATLNIC